MPYQDFDTDSMDAPLRPARITCDLALDLPVLPAPRKAPWLKGRLGFVGSRAGYDLLRFEVDTLIMDPETAPALIAAGTIDALVIESAQDDLMHRWGLSFFDWAGAGKEAQALLQAAADHGVARIALLRGNGGQVDLFAPLARAVDHVLVTDPAAQAALAARGIAAQPLPDAIQPALYHGFIQGPGAQVQAPPVISLDLDRALDDPDLAAALNTLVPFGLGLSAGDIVVRQHRVDTLPPALKDACLGTTTIEELRHLFAGTDMLVQVARPVQASARDIRHALHAAASRCAVVVLGTLDPLDPRADFAHSFDDIAALRLFVSRFQMDAVHAQLHMQSGWRHVHSTFGASAPAARIAQCIDPGAPVPAPARLRATVVTPTMRPERLAHILATFRAQTWDNKELLIVANTDTPEQWDTGLLQSENAEQIAFLPSGFGPATALNMGATRGGGDYVLRMDDDDAYGPHYVGDLMLAADALQPDVMGKTASFFNYVDEDRLLRIDAAFNRPEFYNSSQIYAGGHIAGFSHVVRRSVLLRTPYTEGLHAAVDVGFLDDLHDDGSLLCLRVDAMNAVVERRADVRSHTWQNAPGPQDARYVPLHVDVDTVLGTGRTL